MASPDTAKREELIAQFREISGLEHEASEHLLEAANWSVEDALAIHFAAGAEGDQGGAASSTAGGSRPSDVTDAETSAAEGEVLAASADATATSAEADPAAAASSGSWFGSLSRAFTGIGQALMGIASEDFDSWFEERYGLPMPTFCKENFGEAVKTALTQKRLLLLWLHQEEGEATEALCRQVLQNELALNILEESYVVWAGDVGRFEPGQISRQLSATIFPTVIVCQPLAHTYDLQTFCLEWPMGTFAQPLFRLSPGQQGESLCADQVIAALTSAAEDHNQSIQSREAQLQRRNSQAEEARRLREEQDREFEESLLADQIAAVRRIEEAGPEAGQPADSAAAAEAAAAREAEAKALAEAEAKAKAEAEAAAAAEEQRQRRAAEITALPEPAPAGRETAKISVRLPSGESIQRIFRADQPVGEVYEWAHCCRPSPLPLAFDLCTTFPARALTDRSAILSELDLTPSAVLLLKTIED
mmetsp:Transcript_33048/g.71916  ORF Transcript_33048/g.71916 Transcript_33048/m.71916 type:complete len:477 (+) Transcript_33048:44-1474(+)